MEKLIFTLFSLIFLSSCATGIPYSKIQTIKYNDYVQTVFNKLGANSAEKCKLDEMDVEYLVYKCPVSSGPDTYIYLNSRTYRVKKIKRDWDGYNQKQKEWAQAVSGIANSVSQTIEKNNTYEQPTQPVVYENPFSHMQNNNNSFTPQPIGEADDLFKY